MEMLRAEHISKAFDSRSVLRDVTVRLEEGELVSILGLSGSGKTTLLNIISGLTAPDDGKVTLAGRNITGRPGRISYMLQKDLLLEHKTVLDNVSLPLVISGMKKQEARKQAEPWFGRFGLEPGDLLLVRASQFAHLGLERVALGPGPVQLLDEGGDAVDDFIDFLRVHESSGSARARRKTFLWKQ